MAHDQKLIIEDLPLKKQVVSKAQTLRLFASKFKVTNLMNDIVVEILGVIFAYVCA